MTKEDLKPKYVYEAFITDRTEFGLFDYDGNLRYTASELDQIFLKKALLGWGEIRRIKITEKGIEFGEVIK